MSETTEAPQMFGAESETVDAETSRARIRLFVEALRSGKWVQICGALTHHDDHNEDGQRMCCALGVAIDVAIENGIGGVTLVRGAYEVTEPYLEEPVRYRSSVPARVLEWYGLSDAYSGAFIVRGQNLDYWNDCMRKTFDEIADMIEAEYLTEDANG